MGIIISTVDHLVLTSSDKLIFKFEILFSFKTKQTILMRSSTVLSLPPSVSIPWLILRKLAYSTRLKLSKHAIMSATVLCNTLAYWSQVVPDAHFGTDLSLGGLEVSRSDLGVAVLTVLRQNVFTSIGVDARQVLGPIL